MRTCPKCGGVMSRCKYDRGNEMVSWYCDCGYGCVVEPNDAPNPFPLWSAAVVGFVLAVLWFVAHYAEYAP